MLASRIAPAGAQDAPLPTVPAVAVQVDVNIPGVTVNVQAGAVAISVSTADVQVSVAVATPSVSSSVVVEPTEQQQPTQTDAATDCCHGGEREVAPGVTSATTDRAPRTAVPEQPRPARTATRPVQDRMIRTPGVDRPRRVAVAKPNPSRTIERRVEDPPAAVIEPSATTRPLQRPKAAPWPAVDDQAPVRAVGVSVARIRDNRLLLQLGLLVALLYLVCLAVWVSATTSRRKRA